ncbi:MAG: hypothetical protein MK198_12485 [Gracilimonas sp.]|uniref:hypothetical protein n=1 Tax=Gracilimonas sp. TaxID=1974203 RepID=UPI003750E790|nr:hypothetical protein [Gracilimonas sp.]
MNKEKIALILDNIDRGTITTTLQTNGYTRKLKLLNSSVNNWESICKILEKDTENEIIVLGKFTEHTLFRMCTPAYRVVVKRLLKLIATKKHILFIYKDNLIGNFSYFSSVEIKSTVFEVDNEEDYWYFRETQLKPWLSNHGIKESEADYVKRVMELIKGIASELTALPYEKLIDVEISGQNFIENIAEGLLFRIYIPNDRIWSNEFDKFITLFRDYASNVANEELKITQNRTDLGIICSLYSINKDISEQEINDLYKEFTSFMDLCSSNPKEAEKLLGQLDIPEPKKQSIFKKYAKESQRLLLDIKQEREIKLVTIKHRLQNELQEYELAKDVVEYIENAVPNAETTKHLTFGNQTIQTQNILINPQIIHKVNGIVASEINGDVNLNSEEQQFKNLIEKFSKNLSEATELETSLYELKDNASSNEKKRGAWQKLYGFLGKVGDKVGDVGVALLTKYLEQKMGM